MLKTVAYITDADISLGHFRGERSEFCVTLKTLQRHHIIQPPFKING